MQSLNFCVVGACAAGRKHLRLLHERGDVTVCVAEPYAPSRELIISEYPEIKCYPGMEEAILAEHIDAVILAMPHTSHAEPAIIALNHGIHVFCERLMSASLEECVAMLRTAISSKKILSVGYVFHFDPFIKRIKAIIDSGHIGNIVHYSGRFAPHDTLPYSRKGNRERTPYSLIIDCIDDTDLLCYLTGRIPDYAFSNAMKAAKTELSSTPDIIETLYRCHNGDMAANLHFNYIESPHVHTLEIMGEHGYIYGNFVSAEITVGTTGGKSERFTVPRDFDDVYRAQLDSFIKSVRGEAAAENSAASAIYATLLMQAQKESVASVREVNIHEIAARHGIEY